MVRRGEVWLCALDPTTGHEIRKTRPCVIVSPDDLNRRLQTVIVAPLTSGSRLTRFRVPVRFRGLDGLVLPDQISTLDRLRLLKMLGEIDRSTLPDVLRVLRATFSE